MIPISAGEQVLIPWRGPGWMPVMTLADMQDLAYVLPRTMMQTLGLLITGGAEGMIVGGQIGEPERGRIPIKHLAGVQSGRPIVYADPEGQLYAEPIPANTTGADQWITIYIRRVDIETDGARLFRDDSEAMSANSVTDYAEIVPVRESAGVEVAFDIGPNITEGKTGYLRLGWALLPDGTDLAVSPVSETWEPITAQAHRDYKAADGVTPELDHPDGSIAAAKLASAFSGGFIEDAGEEQDETLGGISQEILGAAIDRGAYQAGDWMPPGKATEDPIDPDWALSARLDRLLQRDPPGGIRESQPDLIAWVTARAQEMFTSTSDDWPSPFTVGADGKFNMNTDAAAKAAGALVRVSAAHNTPSMPGDPETRGYWGDWEHENWGPGKPNPPVPPYHEPLDPSAGAGHGDPQAWDIPAAAAGFAGFALGADWLKYLFMFPSFSVVDVGSTGAHPGQLPTWQHNIGRIVCRPRSDGLVDCFFETYNTNNNVSGEPIMENIYVQRHQATYMFLALGLRETPEPEADAP